MNRYQKPDPRDGWYEIQPGEAQRLLDGEFKNRPLREHHAQAISGEMSAGQFMPNGESVVLDDKGRLLDGQHRCRACVLANRPFRTYVVWGVKPGFFSTFDSMAKTRTGGDQAAILGQSRYNTAASVARWAIRYEGGWPMNDATKVPNWQVLDYIKKNGPEIAASIENTKRFEGDLRKLFGIVVFVYYMVRQRYPEKSLSFVAALAKGADLPEGSPVLAFRRRFLDLETRRVPVKTHYRLALLMKTWRAYRDGRKLGVVKMVDGETFPRFESEE